MNAAPGDADDSPTLSEYRSQAQLLAAVEAVWLIAVLWSFGELLHVLGSPDQASPQMLARVRSR